MKTKCAFLSVVLLAACGGGDDGSEEFFQAVNSYVGLANELRNIPNTPAGDLPPDSTAIYAGYLNSDISGPDIEATFVIGEATLMVDLDGVRSDAANTISGTATRFYDGFEEPLSGSLAITASANSATNVISGTIGGTLSQEGVDFMIDDTVAGAFRRPDGSGIFLASSGDIMVGGSDAGDFDARIVAEKQ